MKDDYISRTDALLKFIVAPDGTRIRDVNIDNFPIEIPIRMVKKILREIPAADVKPVVLCKDCKHRIIDAHGDYICAGAMAYSNTPDDWFCAMGERSDE